MPHARQRYALRILKKKLAYARVVAVQGVRQCGKSFLVTQLLDAPALKLERFDLSATRAYAQRDPDLFLAERADSGTLVIDEAQKVPGIFDALKVRVDENPRPGQYIVLGSTEFNHLSKVRESLTGRMSRLRLFPITLGEMRQLPLQVPPVQGLLFADPRVSSEKVLQAFQRGGMPGVFALGSDEERDSFFDDWLSLTCGRDLHQFGSRGVDSDLALEILRALATLDEPVLPELALRLQVSSKVLQRHVTLLESIFVLHSLAPHSCGTGKKRYFLCDVGIAASLGATRERLLHTWMLQEVLVRRSLQKRPSNWDLSYYRTTKGSSVALLVHQREENRLVALHGRYSDSATVRDTAVLKSLERALRKPRAPSAPAFSGECVSYVLLRQPAQRSVGGVEVLPWAALV